MNDEDIEKALRPLRDLPRVPPERRAAAFDRVHAQWRAELDSRQAAAAASRRRAYAVAASVLLLVFGGMAVWFSATRNPAPQLVATIAAVHGGGDFRVDASIRSGERLETRGSTLSLSLLSGLVVRVAPESVLVFDDAGLLELERGRVFVDSQPARMPDPLIVRTVLGDVRHLGTQYLASFERGELEVAVREGVVALQGTQAAEPRATAAAGEQLRLSAAAPQRIERGVVAAADARWDWIETVPAPLDIEGLSLDRFLQWYGRETGREVSLDGIDPQTRLHGSVAGLMPEDALDAIAAAVELEVIREDDGVVVRRR